MSHLFDAVNSFCVTFCLFSALIYLFLKRIFDLLMADAPIQNPVPEGGGGETPSQRNAEDKGTDGEHNEMTTPHGNEGGKTKAIVLSAIFFAGFEMLGLYCTDIADGLEGRFSAMVLHWVALCCYVAGPFSVFHEMVEDKKARCIAWSIYFVPCLVNALIAYIVWRPMPPEPIPYPHLQLGFETSETNSFWLTNDFLMNNSLPEGKSWIEKGVITNNSPYLLLNMMESQTNLGLLPLFANGPEADAENVHITILIFDALDCSAEKDWCLTKSEHETQLDWQTAFVAKNSSFGLPRIFLNDPANDFFGFSKTYSLPRVPVAMLIEAKNAPLERLMFWLMFATSSETNEFPAKMGIYGGSQVVFNTNRITIHY